MADFSLNGNPCSVGDMVRSIAGAWTADTYMSEPGATVSEGDSAVLSVLGTAYAGTVVAAGTEEGRVRARVVGGAGKLDAPLAPETWRGYEASAIARQCLSDAGEAPGPGWAALTAYCPAWARFQGTLRSSLQRLSRFAPDGWHWRVQADGTVDLVDDTAWPSGDAAVDRDCRSWPQERCAEVYPLSGAVGPGQSIASFGIARQVTRVQYIWGEDEYVARVWYE